MQGTGSITKVTVLLSTISHGRVTFVKHKPRVRNLLQDIQHLIFARLGRVLVRYWGICCLKYSWWNKSTSWHGEYPMFSYGLINTRWYRILPSTVSGTMCSVCKCMSLFLLFFFGPWKNKMFKLPPVCCDVFFSGYHDLTKLPWSLVSPPETNSINSSLHLKMDSVRFLLGPKMPILHLLFICGGDWAPSPAFHI